MTLREKQTAFARLVPRLIDHAFALGFEVTLGELARSGAEAKRLHALGLGALRSLHTARLAIDIHLFRDGVYQRTTEAHRELGEWWEQQHELARWGGRFGDGNHYSLAHEGRK